MIAARLNLIRARSSSPTHRTLISTLFGLPLAGLRRRVAQIQKAQKAFGLRVLASPYSLLYSQRGRPTMVELICLNWNTVDIAIRYHWHCIWFRRGLSDLNLRFDTLRMISPQLLGEALLVDPSKEVSVVVTKIILWYFSSYRFPSQKKKGNNLQEISLSQVLTRECNLERLDVPTT